MSKDFSKHHKEMIPLADQLKGLIKQFDFESMNSINFSLAGISGSLIAS